MKARFFAPQSELEQFAIGKTVFLYADGLDEPVEATISFIAKEAEFTPPVIYSASSREKLVFLVEARLQNADGGNANLRPGLPVEIALP